MAVILPSWAGLGLGVRRLSWAAVTEGRVVDANGTIHHWVDRPADPTQLAGSMQSRLDVICDICGEGADSVGWRTISSASAHSGN